MSQPIYVRTSYTGCPYVTAGKNYLVTEIAGRPTGACGWIIDDAGERIGIGIPAGGTSNTCAHLDWKGVWEIIEAPPTLEQELLEALEKAHKAIADLHEARPMDSAIRDVKKLLDPAAALIAKAKGQA